MSLEGGKKILDRLKELSPESMKVTFFGGEPTLFPDIVLELAKYASTLWPKIDKDKDNIFDAPFVISTNGTFFKEEFFQEWSKLGGAVQVSIDGDQIGMQERTRDKDVLLQIYENVAKIREIISDPFLTCRMTYTPENVGRLAVNVRFIVEMLKITNITHHAAMEADWTEEALFTYRKQLDLLYQYRRFLRKNNIPCTITFIEKALGIIDGEHPMDPNFCGAGKQYVALMPNGDVYPCHRAASQSIFKLGNIFETPPLIRGVFEDLSKISTGCLATCPAARTCHSCPITHYKVNEDLSQPIKKYCQICKMEDFVAMEYLPTSRSDKQDKLLRTMAAVIADLSDQVQEIRKEKADGEDRS
jgi:uncharacterized protein